MSRNYGSRKSSRRGNGVPQQVLVMLLTFVLGYFTASIFDIETLSHWMTTQVLDNSKSAQPVVAAAPKNQQQATTKAKFEFYTLLANEEGVRASQTAAAARHASAQEVTHAQLASRKNPVSGTQTASTAVTASAATNTTRVALNHVNTINKMKPVPVVAAPPSAPVSSRTNHFVVQVASFKARHDAEQMKGSLALKGFEVTVVPITTPTQGSWFRVVIGPYPNRILAQKAQAILARNERLNGMVRSAG